MKDEDSNNSLYRKDILENLSNATKKNFKKVLTLSLMTNQRFGNALIALSNAIYSCERLLCKEILVDDAFPFIKNKIRYKKYNIIIKKNNGVNCSHPYIACLKISFFYFYRFNNTQPELRMYVLQEEIYNNIPKYKSNNDDLYIHFRSGDIFKPNPHNGYVQPPLCFYEQILSRFFFKKIFIISENKKNPVIDALLDKYTNIHYLNNSFIQAVSYIIYAQNLITSTSSFSLNLIRLSKSIRTVFLYNFFPGDLKLYWLISDMNQYKEKITNIIMEPTNEYINKMFPWNDSQNQLDNMIKTKCNKTLSKFDKYFF